jgi:hypothetical protein
MYPAVLLMYFISAAVILLACPALIVQVSLPYNNTGRARTVIQETNCKQQQTILSSYNDIINTVHFN